MSVFNPSVLWFNPNDQRCLAATTKSRCLTCLSLDRELKPLNEKNILALLCPELFVKATPTFTTNVQMICWECKAMILKIKDFRSRVNKAQDILKLNTKKGHYFCEDLSTLNFTKVETVSISPQPSNPLQTVTHELLPIKPKIYEIEIAKIEPLFEEDEPLSKEDIPLFEKDQSFTTVEVKKEKRDSFSGDYDELIQPMTVQQTDSDPLITVQDKLIHLKRNMETINTQKFNYKPQNDFKNTPIQQITGLRGLKEMVKVTVGAPNLIKNTKSVPTTVKATRSVPTTVKATRSVPTTVKAIRSVQTTVKGKETVSTTVPKYVSIAPKENIKETVSTTLPKYIPIAPKGNFTVPTVKNTNEVQPAIYAFDYEKVKSKIMTGPEMQKYVDDKRNDPKFKGTQYKCIKCIQKFSVQETLDMHNKKHDVSSGRFVCDICDLRFFLKSELDEHYNAHFIVYECLKCGLQHSNRYKISEHYRRKHQKSEFECKKCNTILETYSQLKRHKEMVHYLKPTCKECGKIFTSSYILKCHEASFHKGETVTCTVCEKKLKAHCLKSHMKTHEDRPDESVYCAVCDIYLKNKYSYSVHLKKTLKHNSIEKVGFKCDMCGKYVATKSTLLDHIELEHNGDHLKYTCKVCNNVYKSRKGLKNHMQYQHEGKKHNQKRVVCDICGKAFKNKPHLVCHINSHFGRRPFTCQDCGDTFTYSAALWTHRKLVHKVKKKSEMKKAEMTI